MRMALYCSVFMSYCKSYCFADHKGKKDMNGPSSKIPAPVRWFGIFALCLGATCIFYWRIILRGEAPLFGDVAVQFLPWKILIKRTLLSGHFPLWNPYSMAGKPLLANMQSAVLYPIDLLLMLFPIMRFYAWSLLLHTALAGTFTWFLARRLGLSMASATLACIAFMFNGFFLIHVFAGNMLTVISSCWIPAIFLAGYNLTDWSRGLSGKWFRALCATSFALSFQVLSGHPQMSFYTLFFVTLWITLLVCSQQSDIRQLVKTLCLWFAALAIAFCLCAAQLFPTLEYMRLSSRGTLSFEQATEFSFSLQGLLGMVFPEFLGTHAEGTFWHRWYYWSCAYMSTLLFLLALVALPLARRMGVERTQRRRFFVPLWCVVAVSVFLALGRQNPLYHLVFQLPGFSSFRAPAKFLPFAVLGLCLLGARGLDVLLTLLSAPKTSDRVTDRHLVQGLALVIGVILLGSLLIWPFRAIPEVQQAQTRFTVAASRSLTNTAFHLLCAVVILLGVWRRYWSKHAAVGLLLVLVFTDLWNFGLKYQTFSRPEGLYEETNEIRYLYPETWEDYWRIATMNDVPYPEAFAVFRKENLCGYDPLSLGTYAEMFKVSQGQSPSDFRDEFNLERISDALLDAFNVKYVLTRRTLDSPTMKRVFSGTRFDVYERANCPPRVQGEGAQIRWKRPKFNEYRFSVYAASETVVRIAQLAYPGWRAMLNDTPTEISADEQGFMTLRVPEGRSEVWIFYRPQSFLMGLWISVAALALMSICLLAAAVGRSQPKH